MTNYILVQRSILETDLRRLTYQLATWQEFATLQEITRWKKQRRKILQRLAYLPTAVQVQQYTRETTSFKKLVCNLRNINKGNYI